MECNFLFPRLKYNAYLSLQALQQTLSQQQQQIQQQLQQFMLFSQSGAASQLPPQAQLFLQSQVR